MPVRRLLIVGAGGHGRSVAEAVELSGVFEIAGFADDGWPGLEQVWHYAVLGRADDLSTLRSHADAAIVAIGNNSVRAELGARLNACGFDLATVVHPAACVSSRAMVGAGVSIMAGAVVGTEARLGEGVIVNAGAVVDHHAIAEDYSHLSVGACIAGSSVLGRGAWLQAGAAIGYGTRVEPGAIIKK